MPATNETRFSSQQRTVLWVLWLTYGSLYFCRNNLGVAIPGLKEELHYDAKQMGTVLMSLKLAYGVGQFINGQLAEQVRPRKLLAIGLLASAALNVVFGWATALYFLTFVWACNGYVQALGWPPTMRTAANWFPPEQRGRAIGIIGTGYQLCGALTFVVSGWAAEKFGWRGALYIPAILVTASAIHMLIFLKDSPRQVGQRLRPAEKYLETKSPLAQAGGTHCSTFMEAEVAAQLPPIHSHSLKENLKLTLTNPALWIVASALLLLDACRYGFTDWGVLHLMKVQNAKVSDAAFKYAVLPMGGICGSLVAGWMTDKFFRGRPVPMIFILLLALGCFGLAYDHVIHLGLVPSISILFVIGFGIFGAQILLVGTLPVDLARGGTAAAASGFVNFMGYMGAAAGDKFTGHLAQDYGWQFAVRFWAACAFAAAMVIACLWNIGGKKSQRS